MADGAQASGAVGAGGHFDRFNALVENGWLAVLSERELKVLLVYEKHADRDGSNSYPKPETVAAAVGHSHTGQLRVIRKSLEAYGLLRRIESSGGRDWAEVRLLTPPGVPEPVVAAVEKSRELRRLARPRAQGAGPTRAISAPRSGPDPGSVCTPGQSVPGSSLSPGTDRAGQGARICAGHPGPDARAPSKEDQSLDQPRDQSSSSVGCANGASPRPRAAAVAARTGGRLRKPASRGEIAKAKEFVTWYAEAIARAFPDEPFDEASIDPETVVLKLRVEAIHGSVERLKTAAALYLADARPDGHPIDRWRPRLYTDSQVEMWKAFVDWYVGTWPRFHGGAEYEFIGSRDVDAARNFLKRQNIHWDLEWAKNVALYFLATPEIYNTRDHLLPVLAHYGNYYARQLKNRHKEGTKHVIGIAGNVTNANGPQDVAGRAGDDYAIPTGRAREARPGKGADGDGQGAAAAG